MTYSLLTRESAAADLAERNAYGGTPGRRRSEALAIMKEIGDKPAFVVSYGRASVTITGNGGVYSPKKKKKGEEEEEVEPEGEIEADESEAASLRFSIHPSLNKVVAGAAPLNKSFVHMGQNIDVPCGVCVLVGPSGVGKTPLAHLLAQQGVDSYAVVRAGEPFTGYDTAQGAIAEQIGLAACNAENVVIDSIKDLLAASGNAMKGGISRSALVDLSAWAILGATIGVTFYVPLNPSSTDEELMKMMISVAQSNTSMTFSHKGGETWDYQARGGEGQPRRSGSFNFSAAILRESTPVDRERGIVKRSHADAKEVFSGVAARSRLHSGI